MKNMKVLILVFAILGVVSLFIPMDGGFTMFAALKAMGVGQLALILGGFVVAAVMAGMGLAKPPMQQWQAGVALAGFGLVFIKGRMWNLADAFRAPLPMKLMAIAVIGGLIFSIIALVKPESKTDLRRP